MGVFERETPLQLQQSREASRKSESLASSTMKTTWLLGLFFLSFAFGAEWRTSRGDHCTSKCQIGQRYDQEEVYWCPTTDGTTTEWYPKSDSPAEEDKLMWDYCTPGLEALHKEPGNG